MPRTICIAAVLPAPPERLYAMYLDPKAHAAFTDAPVTIAARAGARFEAFGGALTGRILQLVPDRLIVQAWRSTKFGKRDLDSTLVLSFRKHRGGGLIELTQVNVADGDFAGVSDGWGRYYWAPWRAYLEAEQRGRKARR